MLLLAAVGRADEQPTVRNLTAEQKLRLQERDRAVAEVNRLMRDGKNAEALPLVKKALVIERDIFGNDDPLVASSLRMVAKLASELDDFPAARQAAQEAVAIETKRRGDKHWKTIDTRRLLADVEQASRLKPEERRQLWQTKAQLKEAAELTRQQKLDEALALTQKIADVRRGLQGEKHPDFAKALEQLGKIHHAAHRRADAEKAFEQAIGVTKEAVGEDHPDYAAALHALGRFYAETDAPDKALPLVHKAAEIFQKALGDNDYEYAAALDALARLYHSRRDETKAEQYYVQVVAIRKQVRGPKHQDYASGLNTLASFYQDLSKLDKAEALYRQSLGIAKEAVGEKHSVYVTVLSNLAMLVEAKADFAQAEELFLENLKLRRAIYGENAPAFAHGLIGLAALYEKKGEYERSRPLLEQALKICREHLPEHHSDVINAMHNLGVLYEYLAEFDLAEPLLKKGLAIVQKMRGQRHHGCADFLHSLGGLARDRGDFAEAERLFRESLAIRREYYGPKHLTCATSLMGLAGLYQGSGRYAEAERLLREALAIRKELLGEEHPDYAKCLDVLANLLDAMGDFVRAEPLYRQALTIRKKTLGEKHPSYAASLNNLGHFYAVTGDKERAEATYRDCLAIRKERLGDKHPEYALALNNLAAVLYDVRRYAEAERLWRQAADIYQRRGGDKDPGYVTCLRNLANVYLVQGNYDRAEQTNRQVIGIWRQGLGPKHLATAGALQSLGICYIAKGEPAQAAMPFAEALTVREEMLRDAFAIQSERQRLTFLQKLRGSLDVYLSAAVAPDVRPEEIYRHVLAWKGAVAARQVEEQIARDQPALKARVEELATVRSRLSRLAFVVPQSEQRAAWLRQLDELRKQKEDLETALAKDSAAFRSERRGLETADVAKALAKGTVLLDVVEYLHYLPPPQKKGQVFGETRLLAFVLRPDRPIALVSLGKADPLAKDIDGWRQAVAGGDLKELERTAQQLAQRLWKPLEPHLQGATTLLVAPDGALCRFPLAALPGKRPGSYLIEELAIGQVVSGRAVAEKTESVSKIATHGLLAIGGIDYGAEVKVAAADPPRPGAPIDAKGRAGFVNLPGTGLEARRIIASFATAHAQEPKTLLTGAEPDERRVREELARPADKRWRYVHLASHGFFAAPTVVSAARSNERSAGGAIRTFSSEEREAFGHTPLLLSGIVLAGANRGDAGILTAEEVAGLDLRGTDLVVLSACETGLGEVAGGEGVLGLQRAFHLAGARTLVTSLWRVDDAATTLLMEEFYANLWKKKLPKLEALRQAQLTVLAHPETVGERAKQLNAELAKRGLKLDKPVALPNGGVIGQRSHPAWWAAFVLSGDSR
jgi:CHAT domain-containing protein/Tfp pilus assembly protein PilF